MSWGHRSGLVAVAVAGAAILAAQLPGRASALDPSRAPSQYVHQRYETRDGLPQNLVRAISQTPDGYLWVATDEGLARFDGARFEVLDRRNQPGLSSDLFSAFAPDGAGGLWAASREEGVFHVGEDGASPLTLPGGEGEPMRRVRAVARDARGDLWVATSDRGLFQLRDGRVVFVYGTAQGLPGEELQALHVDADGGVWVATDRGAARVSRGAVEPGPPELRGVLVEAITSDRAGGVWFATDGRGVARLHAGSLRFLSVKDGLPSERAEAILCDRDGNVWVGTLLGLALVRDGRVISAARTLPERVLALFEDAEGALWVGTELGLDRLREGDFVTYGRSEGVGGRDVGTVAQTPDGTVWLGTSAGLFRSSGDRFAPALANGRSFGYVLALHADARGGLWVSTRGGAWLAEVRGGRVVRSWPSVPGRTWIYTIASDADGTLWVGTRSGVLRVRGEAVEEVPGLPPRTRVNALARDAAGVLWAATDVHWVWRLEGGRFVPAPGARPPGQPSAVTLWPEADGALWVTTEGNGLWLLRDGRWASLGRPDGMFDDVIWAVLDDGRGQLWFSSNRGVWRVERRQVEDRAAGRRAAPVVSIVYGEADGMRSRECNAGSTPTGLRGRDGRLWFPTTDGVAVADPFRLRPRPPPVRAVVEAVRVDGRDVAGRGAVELPAGAARLEIAYTGVTLVSPERLRFRYRLAGFDPGWVQAGGARLATYTNLPPGSYRFEVEVGTPAEGWGPAAGLGVRQRPRLHQTWWFYALASAAALLLAVGAHLVRTWRLREHERELELRVKEALAEVSTLSGLIPICAWCKKVRDDQGYWQRLESYLSHRSQAQFSHGMCPECFARTEAEAQAAVADAPEPAADAAAGGRERA